MVQPGGGPGLPAGALTQDLALVVGLIAIVLASVNMVGGFVVTDRMLQMFSRKKTAVPKKDEAA